MTASDQDHCFIVLVLRWDFSVPRLASFHGNVPQIPPLTNFLGRGGARVSERSTACWPSSRACAGCGP